MKTINLLSMALLGLVAGCATQATDNAAAARKTEVVFDHPENFRDVRDAYTPTEKGRDAILSNIRSYIVYRADQMLPDGYRLKVVFTDIHLAGNYEPWHGVQWENVRIVKAVYPPAFKFTYSVTDPAGKVVRQGSEDIVDLGFDTRMAFPEDDPLRYEKDILNDWTHSALGGLKGA